MLERLVRNPELVCRYKLGFNVENCVLSIVFEPGVYEWLCEEFKDEYILDCDLSDDLELPAFRKNKRGIWSYGDVGWLGTSQRGWPTWFFDLPIVEGSLDRNKAGEQLYGIAATLAHLFETLSQCRVWPFAVLEQQEIAVRMSVTKETLIGAHLYAAFSKRLKCHLLYLHDEDYELISLAMRSALAKMLSKQADALAEATAKLSSPPYGIVLELADGGCYLKPKAGACVYPGMELAPHNMDTPIEQLSVLAGLAKLDEIARARF